MNTPILLVAYNRPEHLLRLINQLKKIEPTNIYLFCDGPKNVDDEKKVKKVHKCLENISWDCVVEINFLKKNLGCQRGVETAVNWFFSHVESGIVLEDDCLPHPDFFRFTSEMLNRYKMDSRVGQITGYNAGYKSRIGYSYFFSSYSSSWGWATWRNRWENYKNFKKNGLQILKNMDVKNFLSSKCIPKGFYNNSVKALNGSLDSWAYIWSMSNIVNSRLTIVPKSNLIKNIGFGKNSTHTKLATSSAYLDWKPMSKKIIHPPFIVPMISFDKFEAIQHNTLYILIDIIITFIKNKLRLAKV